jgi:hypothetical protein
MLLRRCGFQARLTRSVRLFNTLEGGLAMSLRRVAANPQDKRVLVMGNRIMVNTNNGGVFVHDITGNTIGVPFQLAGPPVAANPQDKWVLVMGSQILVIVNDGRVFAHDITGNAIGTPFQYEEGPEWLVVDAPSITFGTGIAVGGYGRLTVFSDGTTHFQGHLHDSGFPSYDCLAVFTVKDADGRAYAASRSGRVHGTDEPGSRDLDWDDWGSNDAIRENWSKIRSGWQRGYRVDVTSDWSPQKIGEWIIGVVGVVLAIIPLVFSGGGSNKSSDPNYGRPESYPPGGLPPPETSVGGAP